jgi:D-arabinose 1-dehydrogenase-like Zn-dependent alcohol dehydrogenase
LEALCKLKSNLTQNEKLSYKCSTNVFVVSLEYSKLESVSFQCFEIRFLKATNYKNLNKNKKMRSSLILGGSGVLGRHMVSVFKSGGCKVVSMDIAPNSEADVNIHVDSSVPMKN